MLNSTLRFLSHQSESFDESSRILNRHEVQISQTRNQLDESANNLREEVLHLVEKTQSEVSEMKNVIDQGPLREILSLIYSQHSGLMKTTARENKTKTFS